MSIDRSTWPVMVRWALRGLPNRFSAWFLFWLSIGFAICCVAYGFVNPFYFNGGIMVAAALWYYLAIRWVDQHSSWS